ncbi:MAG: type II toxin-antitoxin system prevent-host-death family antitoxin [Acidimicrobiales bacterium]
MTTPSPATPDADPPAAPDAEPDPDLALAPVGVRELRNNVAAVVRRARAGERLLITVDGRPVAQLGPVSPDRTGVTLFDLAAAGLIEPPRRPDRPVDPAPLPLPADLTAARLLDASRGR